MYSGESFLFNGNVKIINCSLNFPIKVPTQKAKVILYKNQIYIANLKNFSNPRSKFIFHTNQIYIENTQDTQDTRRALGHSGGTTTFGRNSETLRHFRHSGASGIRETLFSSITLAVSVIIGLHSSSCDEGK